MQWPKGLRWLFPIRSGAVFLNQVAELQGKTAQIHVNVDTGMGRFGAEIEEVLSSV